MKVLYIGVYNQKTGYGNAALENILALHQAGVDVVCRPVRMTNDDSEKTIEQIKVKSFEEKNLDNVTSIIQHNLPTEFSYKKGPLNVGAFFYETNKTPPRWINNLSLMDKVMVACRDNENALPECVKHKAFIMPCAINTKKFNFEYPKPTFDLPAGTIKFYTISEFTKRKNLVGLLISYLRAFTSSDNVALIIKSHVPGQNTHSSYNALTSLIEEVKSGLGRFQNPKRYAKIIINPEFLLPEELNGLHQSCDIFVSASHGEAWCLPATDALGFGNYVIAPNNGAFKDYIVSNKYGSLVDGRMSPIFGASNQLGLYTSDEMWFSVDNDLMSEAMIVAAKNSKTIQLSANDRQQFIKNNFSREIVGKRLMEQLV